MEQVPPSRFYDLYRSPGMKVEEIKYPKLKEKIIELRLLRNGVEVASRWSFFKGTRSKAPYKVTYYSLAG